MKVLKYYFITVILFTHAVKASAQNKSDLTFSGYTELYYSFDFCNPINHDKPFFLYNHKRHNEVNINLLYAKANYNTSHTRANLALMTGNYAQYNLANEPSILQMILEANLGIKLSKQKNIWLDAGVMPSHIGFESAVSADCWTLSRSILAENSPYYETGVKLTAINKKENFTAAVMYLNGWQRIQKPNNIQNPSFGIQLNYKPKPNISLNYSNFIGTDKPDSLHALRTYHNIYTTIEATKKWGLIAGIDIGTDKNNNAKYNTWYSYVLIIRYGINTKNTMACRGEFYNDKKQILIYTGTKNGFQVAGYSFNYDYKITDNILWRSEVKRYIASDPLFNVGLSNKNLSLLTSLSVKL